MPPHEATRMLREVAWALAYAHGRGIIHRDVKPDNILLEAGTGRALVTDFGIARGDHLSTLDGDDESKVMGTAHFMSPEQAAQAPLDGRSDIYALGVVGYLAVSGRLPFESSNVPALLLTRATEDAPSVMRAAPGLPTSLASAIDRCLARDPAARFADGEAMAAALAPVPEARPTLPPTLRAWLAARNPLLVPYLAWGGLFGTLTSMNLLVWLMGKRPDGPADIVLLAAITSAPLFPIVGFHVNQALKQFRAGHSLADLRAALEVERRETAEADAAVRTAAVPPWHRTLRLATAAAGSWLATTFLLIANEVVHERDLGAYLMVAPMLSTLALGALSNALDVQFIPESIKRTWRTGIRDRLWNSKLGARIARWLGAPERSAVSGANAFRATEAALGVAASELYAALPKAYKEQLAELPAIVASLEARAAEARAELELVTAMAPSGAADASTLATRKAKAAAQLGESVAALEGVRLDLLRLHAGTSDLAPLTTLLDAVRGMGEDVRRLAEAQREVDGAMARPRVGPTTD
jgi:serine/threonine-protein kinase